MEDYSNYFDIVYEYCINIFLSNPSYKFNCDLYILTNNLITNSNIWNILEYFFKYYGAMY